MANTVQQRVTNMDILLSTVVEPTQLSLILIVLTAVLLIQYPYSIYLTIRWWLVMICEWIGVPVFEHEEQFHTDNDLMKWIDEVTAGSWSQLRVLLALSALHIIQHLAYKNFIKAARFCQSRHSDVQASLDLCSCRSCCLGGDSAVILGSLGPHMALHWEKNERCICERGIRFQI